MSELLREKEVASLVGMSVAWLQRKRWEGGGIPFIKMAGNKGAVRYRREDVEAFVNARVRKSTSACGTTN